MKLTCAFAAVAALCLSSPAIGQDMQRSIVSIYHVAPGQHVAFLKWLDRQDKIAAAAGQQAGQLYAHMDGDSWDYVVIGPMTTPAQDEAFQAAAKRMGVNPLKGGIEMRKHVSSHSDTIAAGPISAAQYLANIGE